MKKSGWEWRPRKDTEGFQAQVYVHRLGCERPGCTATATFEANLPAPWYASNGEVFCPEHHPDRDPTVQRWERHIGQLQEALQERPDGTFRWRIVWPSGQVTFTECSSEDAHAAIAMAEVRP